MHDTLQCKYCGIHDKLEVLWTPGIHDIINLTNNVTEGKLLVWLSESSNDGNNVKVWKIRICYWSGSILALQKSTIDPLKNCCRVIKAKVPGTVYTSHWICPLSGQTLLHIYTSRTAEQFPHFSRLLSFISFDYHD